MAHEPRHSQTVFFLGAGFSACITDGALPSMAGFFDRLDQSRYPALRHFVEDAASTVAAANVEEVIALLDQIEDAPLTDLGRLRRHTTNISQIRDDVGRYCLDRLCCGPYRSNHWALGVLGCADAHTTVITTNYDNLAERILSSRKDATHHCPTATCHHCRMTRILHHNCECLTGSAFPAPQWRGSLLKLHGSVAWRTCSNERCTRYRCLVADKHCQPFAGHLCDCCGRDCRPVIVLPSHHKQFSQFPYLSRMWDGAKQALQNCEVLVVFGFSFPTSDCLLGAMLRDAANRGVLKEVVVIDRTPNVVARRVRDLLPPRNQVSLVEFQVPQDGSTPSWIEPDPSATRLEISKQN